MIDGVHIWRAALDDAGWPPAAALPASERERAAGFLREEAARRWVASRWALRRVLREYVGEAAASAELEISGHGKPRLPCPSGPQFNLSHSEGLALVAVAERPVGVDVEAIRPRPDLLALAERGLPREEAAAVRGAAAAERPALFHGAWARQEARLKCLGTGFGAGANRHVPTSEAAAGANRHVPTSEAGDRRLARERAPAVEDLDVAPGYAAAVAVAAEEVGPIECRSLWAG
jgi:4'-phosphopantetheinyl transferase